MFPVLSSGLGSMNPTAQKLRPLTSQVSGFAGLPPSTGPTPETFPCWAVRRIGLPAPETYRRDPMDAPCYKDEMPWYTNSRFFLERGVS
jgi:hypothetical protein